MGSGCRSRKRGRRGNGDRGVGKNRGKRAEQKEDNGARGVGKRRGVDVGPWVGYMPRKDGFVFEDHGCCFGVCHAVLVDVFSECLAGNLRAVDDFDVTVQKFGPRGSESDAASDLGVVRAHLPSLGPVQ